MRKKYIVLTFLILIYLGIRLAILFTLPKLCNKGDERMLLTGTVAKEIVSGHKWPMYTYQQDTHQGGGLILSFLKALFFVLFGYSLYVNAFTSLFIIWLGTFIIIYLLADHFFDNWVVFFSSVLFIFGPQLLTVNSVQSNADYSDSTFFQWISIYVFFSIFFSKNKNSSGALTTLSEKKYSYVQFALWGLTTGLALSFLYNSVFLFITFMLFWYISDKLFFMKKTFFVFLIFLIIGFFPMIYYNIASDFKGLYRRGLPIFSFFKFQPIIWIKRLYLCIIHAPSYFFGNPYFSYVNPNEGFLKFINPFIYLYTMVFVFAFIGLFMIERKKILSFTLSFFSFKKNKNESPPIFKEVFLILYSLIYILGFNLIDFPLGLDVFPGKEYKCFIPLYPAFFLIISIFAEKLKARKMSFFGSFNYKIYIFSVFLSVFMIGIIGNLELVKLKNWWLLGKRYSKGYGYFYLYPRAIAPDSISRMIGLVDKIDGENRYFCYEALGVFIGKKYPNPYSPDLIRTLNVINPRFEGFHMFIGGGFRKRFPIQDCLKIFNRIKTPNRIFLYEGIGGFGELNYDIDPNVAHDFNVIEASYRPYYVQGAGIAAAVKAWEENDIKLLKESFVLKIVDEKYKWYFYEGVGKFFGLYDFGPKIDYFINFFKKINYKYIAAFYEGLGEGVFDRYQFKKPNFFIDLSSSINPEFRAYYFMGIGKGMARVFDGDEYLKYTEVKDTISEEIYFYICKGAEEMRKELDSQNTRYGDE